MGHGGHGEGPRAETAERLVWKPEILPTSTWGQSSSGMKIMNESVWQEKQENPDVGLLFWQRVRCRDDTCSCFVKSLVPHMMNLASYPFQQIRSRASFFLFGRCANGENRSGRHKAAQM